MSPTASVDVLDVLRATLVRLWPGARTELVRSRHDDPTATAEFLLLPSSRSPRLLLPSDRVAAAASVLRFSAVAGPAEIGVRTLASLALRAGATRALPERLRVHLDPADAAPAESLADALARSLGASRTTFSLGVGPARVNRKPVLQVFDERGRSRGFAKLGDSPTAAAHVRAESAALEVLAATPLTTLRVPRPLHVGTWRDVDVLVQEDLAVGPGAAFARGTALRERAAAELEEAYAEEAAPLDGLPWWERCRSRADAAPDRTAVARLGAAMEAVARRHPSPVPVSAWHGDWTPWNMAPGRGTDGGRVLLVWDWERFETGVPAGMDRVHFAVNAATLRHGATPAVVLDALPGSGPVEAAYLVAITARYLEMSSAPGGELIVPRALATLAALESLVSADPPAR